MRGADRAPARPSWRTVFRLVAVGLVTLVFYRSACTGFFLADDLAFLGFLAGESERGTLGRTLLAGFVSPPDRGAHFYRPLLDLSYALDYRLWGAVALGWHLTDLFLHLANALLLAALLRELLGASGERDSLAPVAAAALFAWSPIAPESVAWISGRSDELALAAMLGSLLLYLRSEGRLGWMWAGSLALFALGLASKEAAITLPGWVAALHLAGWRSGFRRLLRGVSPFALLAGACLLARFAIFGDAFTVYAGAPEIRLGDPGWIASRLDALRVFLDASPRSEWIGRAAGARALVVLGAGLVAAARSAAARER
jgi:hypothetical protein